MNKNRLTTECCGIRFKNPVLTASGPAGNGEELSSHINLFQLGGFTSKTVTLNPTEGNPPPRIVDVYGGIINSIGLQNPGFYDFMTNNIPFLERIAIPSIVSIASNYADELEIMTEELNKTDVNIIEINFSCPNVDKGKEPIGSHPMKIFNTVKRLKTLSSKPIFVKFGPADDILYLVKAVNDAGGDGIVLSNCPRGMKIDINRMKPILKRDFGGFAGPAIKPITLHQVYQVRKHFPEINIIGTGGIMNGEDALEYIMAGANLVAIGFGVMVDPEIPLVVIREMEKFLIEKRLMLDEIRGIAQRK
ncbi:MAG TPA: dihydroorotate dehydrogenase [Thermotogota bacterium]|nr:dihydroorotate dehydrogenase [Thermotogota bacterium]